MLGEPVTCGACNYTELYPQLKPLLFDYRIFMHKLNVNLKNTVLEITTY